jgi:subtilase family serine protease
MRPSSNRLQWARLAFPGKAPAMHRRRRWWDDAMCGCPFAVVLAGCSASSPGPSRSGSEPAGSASVALQASPATRAVPSWATEDHFAGSVEPGESMRVHVHLRSRDPRGADEELAAISDPASPRYGAFLGDDAYAAKYAPTAEDVAAVTAHLVESGLTVTYVPGNRAYISATGDAAAVERAFSTRLGRFAATGGALRRAPRSPVQLPDAIAARVAGVLGLAERSFQARSVRVGGVHRVGALPPGLTTSEAQSTCSQWFGQISDRSDPPYPGYGPLTEAVCGYHPGQLRVGYGLGAALQAGNDGTGQSVAIVDAYLSPTLLADAQTYFARNDPAYPLASSQFSAQWAPGESTPPDTGWYEEQSLDVEAVHAIAPRAAIAFVGAQSADDTDLVAAINFVIDNRLATIVSNSYGGIEQEEGDFGVWHDVATEAGLKGIGLYFSSGDYGDNTTTIGFPSADFPASLDNVTAVGGTSLALGPTNQRLFEIGWETGISFLEPSSPPAWFPPPPGFFAFGAGGGASAVFAQPTWQAGIVPPAVADEYGAPARAVPDVAMLADPYTGYFVGLTDPTTGVYGEEPIGGTSLSCPLFSATVALAQQHANRSFGFASPALYAARRLAFRDIVPLAVPQAAAHVPAPGSAPNAVSFDYQALTIRTGTGWDPVTGLGVPGGTAFLSALAAGP